jgi:hypothetical protein
MSWGCFWRPWVLTRLKLRLRSVKPSAQLSGGNRFHLSNARKQATQNTAGKRRARQEDVDSDYLLANSSGSLPFNRSTPCPRNIRRSLPSCQTVPTVRFIGNNCPVGVIEPIEVKGHDKTVSRYRENQRISRCSIFLMFVVHNFSPNHSGREQFSCECYRRHLL